MSADPFIQDPFNTQSLNRYSYVNNNPLAYTDPSGYFRIRSITRFFSRNPVLAVAVGVAVAWATGGITLLNGFEITLHGAMTAGGVSGMLTGGVKGAAVGMVSGAATFGIGELGLSSLGQAEFLAKAAMHGTVQGALAEVQGGKFGAAFLASSFSSVGGSLIGKPTSIESLMAKTIASAVVGGVAAEIGGGKFQNGAATGAFVYLFNHATHGYEEERAICRVSQKGCTVGNVMDSVTHHPHLSATGDAPIENGQRTYVKPFGNITTTVDWENHTVINTTESDHYFCCGQVVHRVFQRGDFIMVNTTGTGSNTGWFNARINELGSPAYWGAVHQKQYWHWLRTHGRPEPITR